MTCRSEPRQPAGSLGSGPHAGNSDPDFALAGARSVWLSLALGPPRCEPMRVIRTPFAVYAASPRVTEIAAREVV